MRQKKQHGRCLKAVYTKVGIQLQATKMTVMSIFSITVLGTNGSWFELQGYWIACEIIANAMHADKMRKKSKLNFEHLPCYEYCCSFEQVKFLLFI